ncbi:hypothetical protein [Streptomyces sp. x-80]|uniref:hypothetical protein n=1 Tax=Streptomyces sp. x-80 TaxID=2789282 RepID=UPI00397F4EB2
MATIYSPVPHFTGPGPGGVPIVDGQAQTDDPRVLAYARRHGYRVDDAPPAPARPRRRKEE